MVWPQYELECADLIWSVDEKIFGIQCRDICMASVVGEYDYAKKDFIFRKKDQLKNFKTFILVVNVIADEIFYHN